MAKNNNTSADAMVNAYLTSIGGDFHYVISSLDEASIDVDDEWADISGSRVGTQTIHRTGLTCVNREISAGAALIFDLVAAGAPCSVVALTDAPAGSPLIYDVQNVNDGDPFDMDTLGPLAIDSLIHKEAWNGE